MVDLQIHHNCFYKETDFGYEMHTIYYRILSEIYIIFVDVKTKAKPHNENRI